jgi:hypothetical protein
VLFAPLQTRPNPVAPTLQLLVVLNIIAWPSVIALVYLPNCTMRKLQQRRQRQQQQQQQSGSASDAAGISSQCRESRDQDDAYVFTSNSSRGSFAEQQDDTELGQACKPQKQHQKEEEQQQQGWRQRVVAFVKAQAMPSAIGSIACLYNLVNIYATKFTTSYLVQVCSGPTAGCCFYTYCSAAASSCAVLHLVDASIRSSWSPMT